MKMVVGLGNPGLKYAGNRHNIGFRIIDAWANEMNCPINKKAHMSQIGTCFLAGEKIILIKPQTYMNLSGKAVAEAFNYYNLAIEDLLVVYDDLDMPVGKLRFKKSGSAGGHNGIKSIIAALGRQDFARLKFGIDRSPWKDVVNHVLGDFTKEETSVVAEGIKAAVEGIDLWIKSDIHKVMNSFN